MAISFYHGEDAADKAARAVQATLTLCANQPVLLLMSGGSWLKLVDSIQLPKMEDFSISVLDERYSTDPNINNFAQLFATDFYRQVEIQPHKTIDMRVREGETHDHHAGRFQTELKAWRMLYPDGVIIATMGVGEDGHTSGILPHVYDHDSFYTTFDNPDHLTVHYCAHGADNPYIDRTTTTFPFLRDYIDKAVVYVSGEQKRHVVESLQQEGGNLEEMPAHILKQMKKVDLYTDCV